jgi:hypothetical protein
MKRIKNFKYLSLSLLLFGFVFVTSLASCREDAKKKTNTEQMEESEATEEHPADSTGNPADSTEHPAGDDGEEHPDN